MDSKTWADAAKYAAKEAVKGDDPGHEEKEETSAIAIIKSTIAGMEELEKSALISATVIKMFIESSDGNKNEMMDKGRQVFIEANVWKLIKVCASTAGLCLLMNDLNFIEELNETIRKMSKEYIDKVEARKNKAN